jgi:hypothetical protein
MESVNQLLRRCEWTDSAQDLLQFCTVFFQRKCYFSSWATSHEGLLGTGGKTARILNLSIRWGWVLGLILVTLPNLHWIRIRTMWSESDTGRPVSAGIRGFSWKLWENHDSLSTESLISRVQIQSASSFFFCIFCFWHFNQEGRRLSSGFIC